MAARAKKTNARGEASPDAELGAEVEEVEPVAEVVFEPVELAPELVVLDAEEDLEPLVVVEVELLKDVLVTVATEEEPVEDEAPEVEDGEEELETPPINWNCGL